METESQILTGSYDTIGENMIKIYPHGFENFVIVVENNTTTTATSIDRIFTSPIIYLWILLIFVFVVTRCGLQCVFEPYSTDTETRRQRCALMCQDTVQLSCGVVMTPTIFESRPYVHTLFAHGATIIPIVAGMFISGLLYGDYLIHSQTPNIDSIAELERSNLFVYGQFSDFGKYSRLTNFIFRRPTLEVLDLIWSAYTEYAYLISERYASIVDMEHLRRNGRPLFHVLKERYGVSDLFLRTNQWFLQDRMSTIVMRLHEHGFVKYFAEGSKRTTKETSGETGPNSLEPNTLVAAAGGLQEILVACYIYLVGMVCGIFAFALEYFTKKNSQ